MISHQYKCIFIHIPKTAGSSIYKFFFPEVPLIAEEPNYEMHYGWCPKRKFYLQHASAYQLLDTELISEEVWRDYFKFVIVRNPWDRSYSDYLWAMRTSAINDSFKNYITAQGDFKRIFSNPEQPGYKGNHLLPQSDFFAASGKYAVDYVGDFENLQQHMRNVAEKLNINRPFTQRINGSTSRHPHYSSFYTTSRKRLVEEIYKEDIERFQYKYEDRKGGLARLKNLF